MTTRLTKIQLTIFAIITAVCLVVVATTFLHLPSALGIGSYEGIAEFVVGGGLYEHANVAYRGVTVGRVLSVDLTDDGVDARMRLNDDTKIPADVTATVRSVSAVGEQYIDLVPRADRSSEHLVDGFRIGREHTDVGQDVADLLKQADALIAGVGDTRIKDLLHETFRAFNGSGPELGRLLGAARLLVDGANEAVDPTLQLIGQIGPLLDTQIDGADAVTATANGLARFTTELAKADPQVRALLPSIAPTAETADALLSGIRPSFPMLAANLANVGRIGVIYQKSIEQALVIIPAQYAAFLTVAGGEPADEGGKLDFKIDLNDPPPCLTGFMPAPEVRTPADTTIRDVPKDLYCKTPQNDPSAVRGARNYPCMEFPGKRAPTVALCRDPKGYVPLGSNPWRGPPVPVGTPITNPLNILPPNKFPYIPPDADYDPGPPVVRLPPGVPPGPGPAPNPPFPLPFPPDQRGPQPPPLPFRAPPDQQVPPYGVPPPNPNGSADPFAIPSPAEPPPVTPAPLPAEAPSSSQPVASAPRVLAYDKRGLFTNPAGPTGIFNPGVADQRPAETWVDLMLDPRSA